MEILHPSEEALPSTEKDMDDEMNLTNEGMKRKAKSIANCVKKRKCLETKDIAKQWKDEELVADSTNVPACFVKNILHLLDEDCTVPFIVRYRSEMTGGLAAEKVREVEIAYANVKLLHKKAQNIAKSLLGQNIDVKVVQAVVNARSIEELDYLYAPFKPGNKRSLAEKARILGLEPASTCLLEGHKTLAAVNFNSLVNLEESEISSVEKVKKSIQNIIADIIAKDKKILEFVHQLPLEHVRMCCCQSASSKKEDKKAYVGAKQNQNFKFENYFNFNCSISSINAHQIMAINRGEKQKVLTVKIIIPASLKNQILNRIWSSYFGNKNLDSITSHFMNECIEDSYSRLIEPHIRRFIRSDLAKKAEKEAVTVFCSNLKCLLLTPPVRGKVVIGVDPGYKHGCKIAAVSCSGEILHTDVLYPLSSSSKQKNCDTAKIVKIVLQCLVEVIAIGNGTACRDTEVWISDLIKKKAFHPQEIKYCIVNESGASIYSVTKEAEEDLPGIKPNLRSAVSIARRLQDPLLEYVKVEPKHLGIGMYQHDVSETTLKTALDGVVVECVSFVGVDLNVCPLVLLRKISGLSTAKAKQIISWREKHGGFVSRRQLLDIKGLGSKSFEQCAGFVKILPETSSLQKSVSLPSTSQSRKQTKIKSVQEDFPQLNLLDTTIIHPESYEVAKKFLTLVGAQVEEIGTLSLIASVENFKRSTNPKSVAEKLGVSQEKIELIIDALSGRMEHDIRAEYDTPLFHSGIMALEDLETNQVISGRITNVTNFGAFVDIGVGNDGLIHVSKLRKKTVNLGDHVTVKVLAIDVNKKRISLGLEHVKSLNK